MARDMPHNSEKQNCYFSSGGWTTQITLIRLDKSVFWRSGFLVGEPA
jgi:hypothetical protein